MFGDSVVPGWNEALHIAQALIKLRRGMFKTAALLPLLMKPLMRNRFLSPLPRVSGHSCVFGAMRLKVLL